MSDIVEFENNSNSLGRSTQIWCLGNESEDLWNPGFKQRVMALRVLGSGMISQSPR